MGGYWFHPLTTASAAFANTSSGNGPSGKPWPRLTASCSRASRDITSKTETGRLAKTEFIVHPSCPALCRASMTWIAGIKDVMAGTSPAMKNGKTCSRLGRQAGFLPGLDAAGKVRLVGQPRVLGDQRGCHRTIARAAREYDLFALRVRQRRRVELRHRHVDGFRIALDVRFVRLAHIDQQNFAVGYPSGHLFGREIFHAVTPERHLASPHA